MKNHQLVYSNKEKFAWIQLGKVGSTSIFRVLARNTKLEYKMSGRRQARIRNNFEFDVELNFLKKLNNTHFTFIFVK